MGRAGVPAAVYLYAPDRKAERPASHLERFKGVLHVDGYAGFEPLEERGDVVVAACLSHTRRKFYDVAQATNARSRSRRCAASANFMPSKRRARSVACTAACGASLSLQANRRRFARLARVAASVAFGTEHARRGDPLRVGGLAGSHLQ